MLGVVQRQAAVHAAAGAFIHVFDVIDGVDAVPVDERATGAVEVQMLGRQHR